MASDLEAASPDFRHPSILAQLACRSEEPNGGRADQFGATAVDRDYAATLIAVSAEHTVSSSRPSAVTSPESPGFSLYPACMQPVQGPA
ncbi:hypothetical protein PFLUV_G00068830 [Perca fluviatilis]|uniref:Uncharacterized protein n=1 Tax=Perca fluviatilis TaxID=8168 RepID=A0A6A5FDN1_PERFL|nr:hypothetical protein PFLUV_G00068830 [Perca fluviatilis]